MPEQACAGNADSMRWRAEHPVTMLTAQLERHDLWRRQWPRPQRAGVRWRCGNFLAEELRRGDNTLQRHYTTAFARAPLTTIFLF